MYSIYTTEFRRNVKQVKDFAIEQDIDFESYNQDTIKFQHYGLQRIYC